MCGNQYIRHILFDVKGIAQCHDHEYVILSDASSIVHMITIVHAKYILSPSTAF